MGIVPSLDSSEEIFMLFYAGSLFCGMILGVHSSLPIILLRKRELIALL